MKTTAARRIAWSIWALTLVTAVLGQILVLIHGDDFEQLVLTPVALASSLIFATAGALIVSRHVRQPIGWLFCELGLTLAILLASEQYLTVALSSTDRLFVTTWLTWLSNWLDIVPLASIPLVFLLYPTGRVPSPRWRPVVWVMVGAFGLTVASWMLMPRDLTQDFVGGQPPLPNPTGIAALDRVTDMAALIGGVTLLLSAFLSVVALVLRFRRARGEERQQIKWLAYVAATAALMFLGSLATEIASGGAYETPLIGDVFFLGFVLSLVLGVPVACSIALLKYRLYDLDIVIKKTVVFAILAALITLVYVAVVVGIGALVGSRGNTALTFAATAIVAIAFQPARTRARRFADRIVYGKRATPYEVLSDFSERVGETYSTEDVLPRMAQIVGAGTGATRAAVWLRVGRELRRAARWPFQADDSADVLALAGEQLPSFPGGDVAFPVRHQGELLGAISVATPPSEPLTPSQEKLITDLAAQAGLVLRNVRLIEELRASRQRIVVAQDDERRRLERNIHDGAQQQLVALSVKLALVRAMAKKDADRAEAMLGELQAEAKDAMENLRDLARGIYPPLLADQGLVAALEAQARKAPIPVEIVADEIGRYPEGAEAAVYFSVLEALQNVAKYADASKATVRLLAGSGQLTFSVIDDGAGFDLQRASRGAGLTNIADRLAALGGDVEIDSSPGQGTRVTGRIAVPATEAQA